jgi:hypothetical protein
MRPMYVGQAMTITTSCIFRKLSMINATALNRLQHYSMTRPYDLSIPQ